jgi:APA family basic amino acid/polyamine antiporter
MTASAAPTSDHEASSGRPGLLRAVGRWGMVALMLNAVIGAGIFGLPSRVHALAGPWALAAYLVCALLMACIVLCFAEVASRFTLTGGPYLYTRQAFGDLAGFLIGWLVWITRLAAIAAIANVMASYLSFFWAPAAGGWGRAAALTVAILVLTIVNLVGVRDAVRTVAALTVGKLVPLLLFVVVGMFFLDPGHFAHARPPAPGPFSKAVLQLVFAFGGFEAAVVTAGESRDPRRDMPIAVLIAIGAATALYLLIQVVCVGTLPELAASPRPLADAAARFAGAAGGAAITSGALLSTLGTMGASLLVAPRVLYAMAEQGQIPAWFGRTHARYRTPHLAILITTSIALALALSGTFAYLATLSVVGRLLTYASTAGAMLLFRKHDAKRDPERAGPAQFQVPAGAAVATVALLACLWLLSTSALRELRDVGLAIGAGLVLYAVRQVQARSA